NAGCRTPVAPIGRGPPAAARSGVPVVRLHADISRGAGRGGAAIVLGRVGDDDLELVTLVALLHLIARAGGVGDVAPGMPAVRGGLPLVGQRVVILEAGDDGVERVVCLRRPADRHRDARCLVDDRRGRIAGYRSGEAAIVPIARG